MQRYGPSRATRARGTVFGAGASTAGLCAVLYTVVSCAGSGRSAAFEPRFVAVHNALTAIGLAQAGPLHQGFLAERHEQRVSLDLEPGCTTIVAVGGDGIRDLDAALVDREGQRQAHDTTIEPQAVLRVCIEAAGTYVLVIRAAAGGGTWVAGTWQGSAGEAGVSSAGTPTTAAREPSGTCRSPIPIAAGTFTGSTTHGDHENTGSCGPSDSRELVYELDVPERQRVMIDVEARFDSVLYVRKDDCTDSSAEIDCSDDSPDRTHSKIERVLEPGKYYVFVDGYGQDEGPFKMTVAASDVLALADVCRGAPLLSPGALVSGSTEGMADNAEASCGEGARGADAAWRVELANRSRLRVVERSDDVSAVVHIRRICAEEQSEVACGQEGPTPGEAVAAGTLEAGTYAVFADAIGVDTGGRYTLRAEVAPPDGSGTAGDGCADALPITAAVDGDTFAARDDVAASCSGQGAADVVYRLDLPHKARFTAMLEAEEAPHVIAVWSRCGERPTEIACGQRVSEVLPAGTYFVGVDGATPDAAGRFRMSWATQDLAGQSRACAAAPTLAPGQTITGSTVGAADQFFCTCAGGESGTTGADRVYRVVVAARSQVQLAVTGHAFDLAVALRKTCADAPGSPGAAEVACEAVTSGGPERTTLDRTLDPGTYWVVVDGQSASDQGSFTLQYRVKPAAP
ncbi:MAG: hypothetical protein M3O50_18755 [Myxococcota bacterium]|nr:hypothetical protein [Myxococcota bacterium]